MSLTKKLGFVRRPDRAAGGLTAEESARMAVHARLWIDCAMRTEPIEPDKIVPAITALYAAAGLPEPRVVIVPSPLVMAFAGGFASAIWRLRDRATDAATDAATSDATRAATYDATDDATDAATRDAIYAATREATHAATRAAIYDATDAATDAATRDAIYAATREATHAAIRAAIYAATDAATRDAIYAATREATHAATRAAIYDATDAATRDATRAATDAATRAAIYAATDAATRDATRAATYDATSNAIYAATGVASLGANTADPGRVDFELIARELLGEHAGFGLRCSGAWWRSYQGGNMWAPWDAYVTAARDVLGLQLPAHAAYATWEACAIHGGFRWMHAKFCMVCDFPSTLRVDERRQPHCADGPSHLWRDGWSLYHWHGLRVRAQIIERSDTLTVAQIDAETNVEVRRVMVERFGEARYLEESGAELIAEDEFGQLYRRPMRDDEPLVMVAVMNSTAEPDGSRKRYWLRVAPDLRPLFTAGARPARAQAMTALNAVASTFGLRGEEYLRELVEES